MQITATDLRRLAPNAADWIVDGIVAHQGEIDRAGINTPLRLCHFLAQIAHESAGFRTTREFASGRAYEGRDDLGNTHPGDGERFRGRGLIQLTGRANARAAGRDLNRPYEDDPALLEKFPDALFAALWFWSERKLNTLADRDDELAITKKINGGTNGLKDRRAYLARAKRVWMSGENVRTSGPRILRRGANGDDVLAWQKALMANDVMPRFKPNGVFGSKTEEATMNFQRERGLRPDGRVGAQTRRAAEAAGASGGKGPADIDKPRPRPAMADVKMSREQRMAVQRQLYEKGWTEVGYIDGVFGRSTRGAIRNFRAEKKLPAGDKADAAFIKALNASGSRPISGERAKIGMSELEARGSKTITTGKGGLVATTVGGVVAGTGAIVDAVQENVDTVAGTVDRVSDSLNPLAWLWNAIPGWALWLLILLAFVAVGLAVWQMMRFRLQQEREGRTVTNPVPVADRSPAAPTTDLSEILADDADADAEDQEAVR